MLYTDDAAHVGGGVQPEVRGPVRPRGQHEHHQPPALQHPQGHRQVSTRQFLDSLCRSLLGSVLVCLVFSVLIHLQAG